MQVLTQTSLQLTRISLLKRLCLVYASFLGRSVFQRMFSNWLDSHALRHSV